MIITNYSKSFISTDKLVIKLAKVNSNAVLAFNELGPCYISQNAVDGLHECAKFFPKGYVQDDEEEEESGEGSTSGKKKKKRKKKKGSGNAEGAPVEGNFYSRFLYIFLL